MDISPTLAKQEVDVIKRILEQSSYSESVDEVKLELIQFKGKHFNHLTTEKLLKRIKEISTKLSNLGHINSYRITEEAHDKSIYFDINTKIHILKQYQLQTENYIARIELQSKSKKANYFWLNEETSTAHFVLPNGSTQSMTFHSERGKNRMFLIFKVLYDHWFEFHQATITKTDIKANLAKSGWADIGDKELSNYVGNIRKTKIKPAKLFAYIQIQYDKDKEGYYMRVAYAIISPFTPTNISSNVK